MRDQGSTPDLGAAIRAEAKRLGFEAVGFAPLRPSDHAAYYRDWLAREHHGEMGYLARPDAVAARADPTSRWPELRTVVVVAHHYATSTPTSTSTSDGAGVIARYARGRDYHKVVKKKLLELLRFVEAELGRELPVARAYVDTGPVLERELARRAGIGWFGRNTMLIDPRRGSYFFLGSLLLPVELDYDEPFEADRCGSCNACVEACPTGALLGRDENGAPVMDARLCISYLTIENRGPIPEALRPAMGNRVYGCDICQEVCPWNSPKIVELTKEPDYSPDWRKAEHRPGMPDGLPGESPSMIELLETALDEAAWDAFSRGSAIRRAGRGGFARNVCVGLGNWGSPEAVPVLTSALSDPESLVRAHAAWALGRVGSGEAKAALSSRTSVESDESVRSELAMALAAPPSRAENRGSFGAITVLGRDRLLD
jgi:epoxyqueuosine reductase